MPAKTEKARRYFGWQLGRRREGLPTEVKMSTDELEKMASKPGHHTPGDGTGTDAGSVPTRQGSDQSGAPNPTPRSGGFKVYNGR